jgi:uncharacterized membrane protein YoaK (UPF0700 family)
MLVGLTLVTGLVDAFSYLVLGHVFVANMTGNIVFLGFALAGAPGFSFWASVVALVSFWVGALLGGRLGARLGQHRGRFLATAVSVQAAYLLAALILSALSASPVPTAARYPLIVLLAIAMGLQNASARKLAVPDLTTTVLTLTITGTAADSALVGGSGSTGGRRFTSVATMFLGALIGALLIRHGHSTLALAAALAVLVVVAASALRLRHADADWVRP